MAIFRIDYIPRNLEKSQIFYHSIVQAVSFSTHALPDTFLTEHPLILLVLILPALVRMENQVCFGRDLCKRLVQHSRNHTQDVYKRQEQHIELPQGAALLMNCRTPQSYCTAPGYDVWEHYWVCLLYTSRCV